MGTNLQDVFDAFFIKLPGVDFTNQEDVVLQLLKSALTYASSTIGTLIYTVDLNTYIGNFTTILDNNKIELIALYMVREYYERPLSLFMLKKQHIGTNSFNKLPDIKVPFEIAQTLYDKANNKVEKFKHEFYSYVE